MLDKFISVYKRKENVQLETWLTLEKKKVMGGGVGEKTKST